MPSQDPRFVLALAERTATKARHTKAFAKPSGNAQVRRPVEPAHPPPPWICHRKRKLVDTPPLWFQEGEDDESDGEYVEVEVADEAPSLIKPCKKKTTYRKKAKAGGRTGRVEGGCKANT